MNATGRIAALALPAALLFAAAPAAAQHAARTYTWNEAAPRLAAPAPAYSLALPGQPASAALLAPQESTPVQQREYYEPTPFIIGGTSVGAFAGALVGYVNCVAGDRDCSVLWRFVAGSAIGSALGAVLWLGAVPQN